MLELVIFIYKCCKFLLFQGVDIHYHNRIINSSCSGGGTGGWLWDGLGRGGVGKDVASAMRGMT